MKTIILIEGQNDIDIILNNKSNKENKIISFDYNSTKILNEMKLESDSIDNYFKKSDPELIDKTTVNFTQNWYQACNKKNELDFKKINLGYVIEAEIVRYFLFILRRILGIVRILEKEKPEKIICSSLEKFVKNLCNKQNIIIQSKNQKINSELEFSNIEIPINMGFKKNFTISRKNYSTIKKIVEGFLTQLLSTKFDINKTNNNKTILLLDFNPVFYSSLLEEINKLFPNVLLLNQRRPAIWNKKSFKIIKKTNSKIIRLEDFETSKIKLLINNYQKEKIEELNKLFNNNQLFQDYFKIENNYFWEIIQDNFKEMILTRTEEIIRKYVLSEELFKKIKIDGVLDWAHSGFDERIILANAEKENIPVLFIQHAQNMSNSKYDKFIPFQPILPTINSKTAVWGKISKEFLIVNGISKNKIFVTGSPKHDPLFNNKNSGIDSGIDSGIILLAFSGTFSSYNFHGNEIKSLENLEAVITRTIEIIKEVSNKKIIVKLHPSKSYIDIKSIVQKIDQKIPIYQDEDPKNLLELCDAVIINDISTIMLEAMIFKKPTLCINTQNQNIQEEPVIQHNASLFVSDIKDLKKSIKQLIFDNDLKKNLIKNGNIYVNNYFAHKGNSSKQLANILYEEFYGKKLIKDHKK
jgi:hypothetical protein